MPEIKRKLKKVLKKVLIVFIKSAKILVIIIFGKEKTKKIKKLLLSILSNDTKVIDNKFEKDGFPIIADFKKESLLENYSEIYSHFIKNTLKSINIPCTIIIPVYNAPEYVKSCVQSVIRYTDLNINKLLIINDASTDTAIKPIIEEFSKTEGIIVIENKENIGFIDTINKGLNLASDGDVLILNSDTEVTINWLEKIKKAAYSGPKVGTVTPLTNNGTICSIPKFGLNNELPSGFTPGDMNNLVEQISHKEYPEIPTAVGFCMYIRRTLLDQIGHFDGTYLTRGYYDENDFCCRATEAGFQHILADDTFIFHKGSMSFSLPESVRLSDINRSLFLSKYKYYNDMIRKFVLSNPLQVIHSRFNNALLARQFSKNSVLIIIHNAFDESSWVGGTEYHVRDLVMGIKEITFHVLIENNNFIIHKVYQDGNLIFRQVIEDLRIINFDIRSRWHAMILTKLITMFNIRVIHIHHLLNGTFDIIDVAKKYNIPLYVTIHDTYLLFSYPHLQDFNFDIESYELVKKYRNLSDPKRYVEAFQREVDEMFKYAQKVFSPSNYYKGIYKSVYKNLIEEKIMVIHHGIQQNGLEYKQNWSFPVKFLLIGAVLQHKGSQTIIQIAKYLRKNGKGTLSILGNIGEPILEVLKKYDVVMYGAYSRGDLYNKIKEINPHFILNTAYWPESFCYTFSEAASTGIPIISSPEGAIVERASIYGGVLLTHTKEASDFISIIESIINDESGIIWNKLINERNRTNILSTGEMCNIYENLYNSEIGIST